MRVRIAAAIVASIGVSAAVAWAQHDHSHGKPGGDAASKDTRELAALPEPMRGHMLANMRDHLQSLQAINAALAEGKYDDAASIAEKRLGMTSLEAHGAAHLAGFMPRPMQEIGTSMHRAASRFAIEAQNASATHDVKPALAALSTVMQQCVACHAAYRVQ